MGVNAAMVPQLVPIAREIKQEIRDQMSCNQHSCIHSSHCLCDAAERSGKNKDQTHDHDITVPHSPGVDLYFIIQTLFSILDQSSCRSDEKRHRHGYKIKIVLPDGNSEIEDEEDEKGNKSAESRTAIGNEVLSVHK